MYTFYQFVYPTLSIIVYTFFSVKIKLILLCNLSKQLNKRELHQVKHKNNELGDIDAKSTMIRWNRTNEVPCYAWILRWFDVWMMQKRRRPLGERAGQLQFTALVS